MKFFIFYLIFLFGSISTWGQCPPTGSVNLHSQADVNQFAIDYPNCTTLNSLLISGPLASPSDINDLSSLSGIISTGNLIIRNNPLLTSITFPNLVSGSLEIKSNITLSNISCSMFSNGQINISSNPMITSLDLSSLVSGSIIISSNSNLSNINCSLFSNGQVNINNNPMITSLDFPSLVSGSIIAYLNSSLNNINCSALVSGQFYVGNNPLITSLSAINLSSGSISISNNNTLNSIDFPSYHSGDIHIASCPVSSLNFPSYHSGNIHIASCPVSSLNFPSYISGDEIKIVSCNSIQSMDGFSNLESVNSLKLTYCHGLLSLSGLESLESVNGLVLGIEDCPNLVSLSPLNSLKTINEHLVISYCGGLVSLSGLNSLESIGGHCQIYNNNSLNSLNGLNALESIGGEFYLKSINITSFSGLDALETIGQAFSAGINSLVSFSGLNSLKSIGGNFNCSDSYHLMSFTGLESLESIGNTFRCTGNQNLNSISAMSNLISIGSNIPSNSNLSGIILKNNASLTPFSIPGICDYLSQPNSNYDIQNNMSGTNSALEILNNCPNYVPPTQLTTSSCGMQLTSYNDLFFCDPTTSATQYEFEYTELDVTGQPTSTITTHLTSVPSDNLISAGVPYVGVSYNVRVRAEVNGFWSNYGPICQLHAQGQPHYTEITSLYCNTQLNTFDEVFKAYPVLLATEYEFRFIEVDNNMIPTGNVILHNQTSNITTLNDAGLLSLGKIYIVDVIAKVNGIWSDYGDVCYIISPQTVPTIQLSNLYCNTVLNTINQTFYCTNVTGATLYSFKIWEYGSSAPITYVSPTNSCDLITAGFGTYDTSYSVEVRAFLNGVWGLYGPICSVVSPTTVPETQLTPIWCSGQLNTFNETFYCTNIPGASQYEFKFYDQGGNSSYSNIRTVSSNQLTSVPLLPLTLGTTYTVRVRAEIGGVWGPYGALCELTTPQGTSLTQLDAQSCGIQVSSFAQQLSCNSVIGASHYEFEYTEVDPFTNVIVPGGISSTHIQNWHHTSLHLASLYDVAKKYQVRVRVQASGNWGPFGPICYVESPITLPTTQLGVPFCGIQLQSFSSIFNCASVSGFTNYEFELTEVDANNIPVPNGISGTDIRNWHSHRLSWSSIPGVSTTPNIKYAVRVRVHYGSSISTYGSTCYIYSPNSPMAQSEDMNQISNANYTLGHDSTINMFNFETHDIESTNIYPNPANEFVVVKSEVKDFKIIIQNMNGQVFHSSNNNFGSRKIELGKMANGIYLISIVDKLGQKIKTEKLSIIN